MGHKRRGERGKSFAAILAEVEASGGPGESAVAWSQPVLDGEFTDEHGVWWQLRGGDALMPWKRVQQLLGDPEVRVLRVYANEARDVLPEERESFAAEIRPYLTDTVVRTAGDYTDFLAGEFKDEHHNHLLVVEESC
ncbi:hypothetical protein GCM10009554_50820 [Kribbella koreensis]|uniref:Uncharacterized protein n=1 Tax=Kribbella koreensis TaxID=57909 RepID=A0ABN1R2M2_9ACTN